MRNIRHLVLNVPGRTDSVRQSLERSRLHSAALSGAHCGSLGLIGVATWFVEKARPCIRGLLTALLVLASVTLVHGGVVSDLIPDATYFGMQLWLDASDMTGDGNTTNNPADGAALSSWIDKVHGWSADVSSGTGTATYRSGVAGLAGSAAVELGSKEMVLAATDQSVLNPGSDAFTVFAVGAAHTATDDDSMWMRKGNSYSASSGWSVMAGNTGAAVRANDTGGAAIGDRTSQTNGDLALDNYGIVTLELSGLNPNTGRGTLTGRLDGTNTGWVFGGIGPSADHTYYDAAMTASDALTLGRSDANSTLAEVLVYPGGLSPVQTLMIERYLSAKYGIDLDYDGPERVLYQETFDNLTTSDQPLSDAGWSIHWGDGEQIPDYPTGGAALSYVDFAIDVSNKAGDLLYWTDECSIDLDSHVITHVTWDNNANESTAVHFAILIGDDWYVSDEAFAKGAGDLDFLNATWQPLLFDPGSELDRPGTTTGLSILELGGSGISAFGLYDDYGVRHRLDNVTIYAAVPEPTSFGLALIGLVAFGLFSVRRRKR